MSNQLKETQSQPAIKKEKVEVDLKKIINVPDIDMQSGDLSNSIQVIYKSLSRIEKYPKEQQITGVFNLLISYLSNEANPIPFEGTCAFNKNFFQLISRVSC